MGERPGTAKRAVLLESKVQGSAVFDKREVKNMDSHAAVEEVMNERTQHRHTDDMEPGAWRIPVWLLSVIGTALTSGLIAIIIWGCNVNAGIQSAKANSEFLNTQLIEYKGVVHENFAKQTDAFDNVILEQTKRLDRIENKLDQLLEKENK